MRPQKSYFEEQSKENQRDWTKERYESKNKDSGNHYDWSRKDLNFEVSSKGISPLSADIPLHLRLQRRLVELGFKSYKDGAANNPNSCVDVVFSGDHDLMARLAFGDQDVAFDLSRDNSHIRRMKEIEDWAMDVYKFSCEQWGEENIIGMEVHLDETTPHAHVLFVPVAERKKRGRSKADQKRETVTKVSYCGLFGDSKGQRSRYLSNLHTNFHQEVGSKYGFERGDVIDELPEEEKRERVHKNKRVLEAERQAKENLKLLSEVKDDLLSQLKGRTRKTIENIEKNYNDKISESNRNIQSLRKDLYKVTKDLSDSKEKLKDISDKMRVKTEEYDNLKNSTDKKLQDYGIKTTQLNDIQESIKRFSQTDITLREVCEMMDGKELERKSITIHANGQDHVVRAQKKPFQLALSIAGFVINDMIDDVCSRWNSFVSWFDNQLSKIIEHGHKTQLQDKKIEQIRPENKRGMRL